MRFPRVPTFLLQMLSFLSVGVKQEVDARLHQRAQVCQRLLGQGELDLLDSLRRCERSGVWIVALLACVGAVVGWLVQEPLVGVLAAAGGALVGGWLAGVMVDSAHALGRMVSESHDVVNRS